MTNLDGIVQPLHQPTQVMWLLSSITTTLNDLSGFKSYRPMIFVDETFMKGRAKGTLLAATAKNGDNSLFLVAFVVVSTENMANWEWYL
ncbi:hypothetical protein ACS0TY_029344 [Phlomoides rotata]